MTQYLSRKERRAAEKSGIPAELTIPKGQESQEQSHPMQYLLQADNVTAVAEQATPAQISDVNHSVFTEQIAVDVFTEAPVAAKPAETTISRRALREAQKSGQPSSITETEKPPEQLSQPGVASAPSADLIFETVTTSLTGSQDLVLEPEEEISFTGTNLLAEPSTQSIVLDVVPEAVSLPLEVTGEIVSTGSIAVIPDTTASVVTATMDGSQLDRIAIQDAVTGVISVVEPVSAISVINDRPAVGVVPEEALRKGWWIKWLIGIAALAMAGAAIWATVTILGLI